MIGLFHYNWQVRDEWFRWCDEVPQSALLQPRTGGVGGILPALFHIVDVEYSWIRAAQGKSDIQESFECHQTPAKVKRLSDRFRPEVEEFIRKWSPEWERQRVTDPWRNGSTDEYTYGEILRHLIAHEIHHMGQLSVWAREIGRHPVSANVIGRKLVTGR